MMHTTSNSGLKLERNSQKFSTANPNPDGLTHWRGIHRSSPQLTLTLMDSHWRGIHRSSPRLYSDCIRTGKYHAPPSWMRHPCLYPREDLFHGTYEADPASDAWERIQNRDADMPRKEMFCCTAPVTQASTRWLKLQVSQTTFRMRHASQEKVLVSSASCSSGISSISISMMLKACRSSVSPLRLFLMTTETGH